MQDKEKFVQPIVEIIVFPEQDIVTTSGGLDINGDGPGIVLPDDEW